MRNWLRKLELSYQVSVGVAVLMTVAFGTFGVLALKLAQGGAERARLERLRFAEATAIAADTWITNAVTELGRAGAETSLSDPQLPPETLGRVIDGVRALLGSYSSLSLHRLDGRLVVGDPQPPPEEVANTDIATLAGRATGTGKAVIGPLFPERDGVSARIVVVAPVNRGPAEQYVLVGLLSLFGGEWLPLGIGSDEAAFSSVLIGRDGQLLAGTGDAEYFDEHLTILADSIANRRLTVAVHDAGGGVRHLVSYAPLSTIPAAIIGERMDPDASDATGSLTLVIILFGFIALAVASAAAWVHARWVTRPLKTLEEATRHLAEGSLDEPLVSHRGDEIGKLTESFEEMRKQLRRADEQRTRWEALLEQRVAERTREVRRLLRKVIDAQEEERGRLARELHDETAQTLATAQVAIEAIRRSLDDGQTEQRELIDSVLEQTKVTLSDVRRMVMDLRPSVLDNLSFAEALPSWAEQRLAVSNTRLKLHKSGRPIPMDQAVEVALFRIFQEAINNVVRHSQATEAELNLQFEEGLFVGQVRDNGKGFNIQGKDGRSARAGVGLQSMQERAELLGAQLRIASTPGAGTTVRIECRLDSRLMEGDEDGRNKAHAGR